MSLTEKKPRFFLLSFAGFSFAVTDSPGKCLTLQELEICRLRASGKPYPIFGQHANTLGCPQEATSPRGRFLVEKSVGAGSQAEAVSGTQQTEHLCFICKAGLGLLRLLMEAETHSEPKATKHVSSAVFCLSSQKSRLTKETKSELKDACPSCNYENLIQAQV